MRSEKEQWRGVLRATNSITRKDVRLLKKKVWAYFHRWRNIERSRAYARIYSLKWQKNNPKKMAIAYKKRAKKHRTVEFKLKRNAFLKQKKLSDPDYVAKIKSNNKAWRLKNKEKMKANRSRWIKKNPDKYMESKLRGVLSYRYGKDNVDWILALRELEGAKALKKAKIKYKSLRYGVNKKKSSAA